MTKARLRTYKKRTPQHEQNSEHEFIEDEELDDDEVERERPEHEAVQENEAESPELAAYLKLSLPEREVCWILALYPSDELLSRQRLSNVLETANMYTHVHFKSTEVESMLKQLRSVGVMNDMQPKDAIMHRCILDAMDSPLVHPIQTSFTRLSEGTHSWTLRQAFQHQRLLLDVCILPKLKDAEREQSLQVILQGPYLNEIVAKIAKFKIDVLWLLQLPTKLLERFIKTYFFAAWQSNVVTPFFSKLLTETISLAAGHEESVGIAECLCEHLLYAVDVRLIDARMLEKLKKKPSHLVHLGALNFLKGDVAAASSAYEAAFSLSRGRSPFTTGVQALYYMLISLSRLSKNFDNTTFRRLSNECRGDFPSPSRACWVNCTLLLNYLQTGIKPNEDEIPNSIHQVNLNPIYKAINALCIYWLDSTILEKSAIKYAELFIQIKDTLPGVARIIAEVMAKVRTPNKNVYEAYLQATTDCYSLSLVSLMIMKDQSEMAIDALERLYLPTAKKQKPVEQLRLAWFINPSEAKIEKAYEQKLGVKGQWSKGRSVSFDSLKNGNFPYLNAKEREALESITYNHKTHSYRLSHKKALVSLIDHPKLFDSNTGYPIELVRGDVTLLIKETDNHYALSMSSRCNVEDSIMIVPETPTRFQVIEFTPEHVALGKIIGSSNSLQVPKAYKARIQALGQLIGQKLTVFSDIDDEENRTPADSSLHAHLQPIGEGIKISFFVRPFGDQGTYFKPGVGFAVPQALIDGKMKRVSRDLPLETTRAKEAIENLPILQQKDKGDFEWVLDSTEEVLETLSGMKDLKDQLTIYWPQGEMFNVSKPVNAKALSLKIKSNIDWFSLDGSISIDGNVLIDMKTILDLLDTRGSRFIPIGDKQFIALTDHFRGLLSEIRSIAQSEHGKLRLHELSCFALEGVEEHIGSFSEDSAWKKVKQRMKSALSHQPVVPTTLQAELRPYQMEGFQWLSRLAHLGVGACLADDMGLGKTLQSLTLVLEHAKAGPTLIVAPMSVCHNWQREALQFAPALQCHIHANNRAESFLKNLGPMQVLITSYGLLQNEIELLSSIEWQTIILDEAQAIKNSHTKRSQATMQLKGKIRIILTGTPLENRLSELWNLFRFINPGLLGSQQSFNKRFADPIESQNDTGARQALKKIIQPFMLRRLKNQVLKELPPKIEKTILIPFDAEEQAFYEALRQQSLEKLIDNASDEKSRIRILAEITRLRRACCHPSLVANDIPLSGTKLQYCMELVEELRTNKHRALIFSQFVDFLSKVRDQLDAKGITYQYLDGSTPMDERQRRVAAFQAGEGEMFLISLKAGGVGLNLTAADYVVHLDPWWNPAVEDQASDRAHRIGQTRTVTIYRIIMEGTIEEKMIKLHDAKRNLSNDILDGTHQTGKLSNDELLALLRDDGGA